MSFSEEHKHPSTTTDESNDSNSSGNKKTENNRIITKANVVNIENKANIAPARPSRKLPEIPLRNLISYFTQSKHKLEKILMTNVRPTMQIKY